MSHRKNRLVFSLLGGAALLGAVLGVAVVPEKTAAAQGLGPKPYTVSVPKVAATHGQPATAQVAFRPAAGYHLNTEFPTSLKLNAPAGVTTAKASLAKSDAKLSEKEGSFSVVLTAQDAGKKVVSGELRFAVCTDNGTSCEPQRLPIAIELDAK
jgi:hypothetical protein